MLRPFFFWLSTRQSLFNFARKNRVAKKFASRFVPGETVTAAVAVAKELDARGITSSLDMLGESVTRPEEAAQARDVYLQMLRAMKEAGIEVNVSVKLTQMG